MICTRSSDFPKRITILRLDRRNCMTAKVSKGYKGVGMDGLIATWYARNTEKNLKDYQRDAKRIAEKLSEGADVLEIAPGPGYLAIELAKLGNYKITGLDISQTF